MTTPSSFSANGLSILVYTPLIQGKDYLWNYTDIVNDYAHTISSNGGYISSDFSVSGNNNFIDDWVQFGLGRHIEVYSPSMQIVWEGFVNQVNVSLGGVNYTRGPLVNVVNRISTMYTPYYETNEPTEPIPTGTPTETIIEEDLTSQARYGIWEKVLNIGNTWTDDAYEIQGLYLVENSNPEANTTLSIGESSGEISVTINCRGYIDWLSNYVYNNNCGELEPFLSSESASISPSESLSQSVSASASPSGSASPSASASPSPLPPQEWIYVSDKIIAVLDEDPNNIFDDLYNKIDENMVIQKVTECENKLAKTIIDDIVDLGGGSDERWLFGIYANRKPVYKSIPTEVEYFYYETSTEQEIESISGVKIRPWDVLPGKWVAVPYVLSPSGIKVVTPRNDPRVFFAEEVTYTAPDKVTITGAKIRRLSNYLAKLGLGGV